MDPRDERRRGFIMTKFYVVIVGLMSPEALLALSRNSGAGNLYHFVTVREIEQG